MLRGLILLVCAASLAFAADPFIEKPYLQLGNMPSLSDKESMLVMWHAADRNDAWAVDYKVADGKWAKAQVGVAHRVVVAGIEPHRVMEARLTGLKPGEQFSYRVRQSEEVVFQATGRARKAVGQPYRFAVFGDCAQMTDGQRAIANQVVQAKPDFLFITGDIVYSRGKIAEYREKYFPYYNTEETPLIRSTLLLAAPGNHDTAGADFTRDPDAMAYFYYWSQPTNGFVAPPPMVGTEEAKKAFLDAAGPTFPKMANFSFDYGNSHWTVLDSNKYNDWTKPEFREWLIKDLKAAQNAGWRFVGFHHPGFNSSKVHFGDQWMRLLAPIFEQYIVDIVFAGHVHNYQRSWPMKFVPDVGQAWGGLATGT